MVSLFRKRRLAILIIPGLALFLTQTLSLQAAEITDQQDPPVSVVSASREGHEGLASYYARRYKGRRTHSGVRYDPKKLTAAHPTLPLGTRVKVVALGTKREVTVTVNDRCRKRSQPFIDLSRAAARKLGIIGKGLAKVRIIPLDDAS